MGLVPNEEEFRRLAGSYNVIPVYREAVADLETPISAYHKLAGGGPAYLLESAEGPEHVGRYSFIGLEPAWTMAARGARVELAAAVAPRRLDGNPLSALRDVMRRYRPAPVPGLPRFYGGAVGYFGYDLVRHLERLPDGPPASPDLPDARFMACRTVVIFDHLTRRARVVVNAEVEGDPGEAWRGAERRIGEVLARLRRGSPTLPQEVMASPAAAPEGSLPDREAFLAAVAQAKEHIRAGDIFQVVLSVRHAYPLRVHPFQVYRALRALNPSPYLFYLDFGDLQLIGSSPEMLVRVEDGWVETRPIAGTRPRGAVPEEDAAREAELVADAKERAEHVMLVDLGRNDVGRVAVPGTVEVTDLMRVERYSHVMHLVSDVRGRLRPDRDAFDALAACFPAGTLTGAPKVRAMEIIDGLEPVRRGPYGGCVGYFGYSGNMDTCIAIRTIVAAGGMAYVQAGAGIVADSVPEREWEECRNKGRALVRALELAEEDALAAAAGGGRS